MAECERMYFSSVACCVLALCGEGAALPCSEPAIGRCEAATMPSRRRDPWMEHRGVEGDLPRSRAEDFICIVCLQSAGERTGEKATRSSSRNWARRAYSRWHYCFGDSRPDPLLSSASSSVSGIHASPSSAPKRTNSGKKNVCNDSGQAPRLWSLGGDSEFRCCTENSEKKERESEEERRGRREQKRRQCCCTLDEGMPSRSAWRGAAEERGPLSCRYCAFRPPPAELVPGDDRFPCLQPQWASHRLARRGSANRCSVL